MSLIKTRSKVLIFFKELYQVWFPWLDIVILTLIYIFLWGVHLNPYRQYQLIKHGEIAIGKISGEDGLYKNSEYPRIRDFIYTFSLPDGRIIKSSAHTFTLDKIGWKKPKYPLNTEIIYLPHQPEYNWIKSDLPDSPSYFFYTNFVFGPLFFVLIYMFGMIAIRLRVLNIEKKNKQNY